MGPPAGTALGLCRVPRVWRRIRPCPCPWELPAWGLMVGHSSSGLVGGHHPQQLPELAPLMWVSYPQRVDVMMEVSQGLHSAIRCLRGRASARPCSVRAVLMNSSFKHSSPRFQIGPRVPFGKSQKAVRIHVFFHFYDGVN